MRGGAEAARSGLHGRVGPALQWLERAKESPKERFKCAAAARAPSAARLPIARGASAPRKAQAFGNIISDYVVELLTMHAVSAAAFFKAEL